ncbi:MAG: hypothetical protein GC183_14620 [Thiobacillus sp.]|nr:hypothetical protein [Thiobacillus sp.]
MNLKPVCLLLSLCYAGSTAAIGLGDINVRSHLGQPLYATVALIGATPATAADCFTLEASAGSIAPPLNAKFSLEQVGGQTLLHIRTQKSVNDPIVQFVVVADCEARLQRDYVLLLDPPALVETAVVPDAPLQQAPVTSEPAAARDKAPGSAALHRPVRRAKRVKPSPHNPPIAGPVAAPRQPATLPPQATNATAKPRLVITAKEGAQPDAALPLQPAADQPERPLPLASDPAVTELSDDNTALSRRIAYLEIQLDRLKKRNAELDAMRAAAAIAPPIPERPKWPLYLLAIGLLAGVGALGNWLGRRNRIRPPIDGDESWVPQTDNLPALPETAQSSRAEADAMPQRMPAIAPPALVESTEVSEGILDQAEVYVAHGHEELAVSLLQEHLREAPTESPVPWLLLLDLLLRAGDHAGYEAASTECSRYFNINLVARSTECGNGLEAYPHLFDQLTQKWNSPEIYDFFDDLIYDHRGGTRLGFEPAAYREILLLRAIAQDVLPLAA